jgi:ATP-dependent DNA helicase RecG
MNVLDARLMIIEQGELYGLAQLHQLRGRVGRADDQGYCMLIAGDDASPPALQRLQQMVDSHDGLELAEADLALRGGGDAIGTRQSGEAGFRVLDLAADAALIRRWHEKTPQFKADEAMLRLWRPAAESVD